MSNLEADIDRGTKAASILNNAAFQSAFDEVRKAIIEKWEATPLRDREGAHELRLMLKLLVDVRANLELAVTDGKFAAEQLNTRNRALSPAEWRAITHP